MKEIFKPKSLLAGCVAAPLCATLPAVGVSAEEHTQGVEETSENVAKIWLQPQDEDRRQHFWRKATLKWNVENRK